MNFSLLNYINAFLVKKRALAAQSCDFSFAITRKPTSFGEKMTVDPTGAQTAFFNPQNLRFNMQVHSLIVHEIEKESESADARLFLSRQPAAADDRSAGLCARLNQVFEQKSDVLQGYLSSPEDALFPGYLQHFADEGFSRAAFTTFSRETMQALQLSLQGVAGAKGGYLVYAHYQTAEDLPWLGIFLVRNTEGLVFRHDAAGSSYELGDVTYLNVDRLALACRIRLDRYEQGGGRCVEVLKHARSQKEISDYFVHWIGLERPASSREMTQTFLQVVQALPAPVDEDSGETLPAEVFEERALNFAVTRPASTVSVKAFEEAFYGGEPTVQNYLHDQGLELDDEFRVDKSAVRQFYNYKLADAGLFVHFTRTHLRNGLISLDGDAIVLHAPGLADQLRDILADEEG